MTIIYTIDPIPKGTDHQIVYQDLIRGVIVTVGQNEPDYRKEGQ
jgi:hypothetical protein